MKITSKWNFSLFFLTLSIICSFYTHSATINVSEAEQFVEVLGTAEHGDVIVVASGHYDLSHYESVDITKAVTIIGESLLDRPTMRVAFQYQIPDVSDDLHLVFQNLYLPGTDTSDALQLNSYESSVIGSISIVDVSTIDEGFDRITVRSNTKNINVIGAYTTGVELRPTGTGTRVVLAYSDITGTDFDSTLTTQPVNVRDASEFFMIGNEINGSFGSSVNAENYLIRIRTDIQQFNMFGNHLKMLQFRNNTNTKYGKMLLLEASGALVSNNLFTVEPLASGGYIAASPENIGLTLRSIETGTSADNAIIQNNVFDYSIDVPGVAGKAMVVTQSPATIKNNIFRGNIGNDVVVLHNTPTELSTVANNLCFEVGEHCPTGDTNIVADPLFTNVNLDTVAHERLYDYSLQDGSPAIDTGFEGTAFFDVDGSIVDIGYNGGFTPFDQYTRSILDFRNDTVDTRPYIIPLLRASQGVAGDNTLRVKFLTFARSR